MIKFLIVKFQTWHDIKKFVFQKNIRFKSDFILSGEPTPLTENDLRVISIVKATEAIKRKRRKLGNHKEKLPELNVSDHTYVCSRESPDGISQLVKSKQKSTDTFPL